MNGSVNLDCPKANIIRLTNVLYLSAPFRRHLLVLAHCIPELSSESLPAHSALINPCPAGNMLVPIGAVNKVVSSHVRIM